MNIKLMTYNIDCLPEKIDLKELPWILKPIEWIYKLIKGTTIVSINDGKNNHDEIIKYIKNSDCDIVGIQEEFSELKPSKILSLVKWPFRINLDGIGIYTNKTYNFIDKVIWNKSYGYFSHANDKLMCKGFRLYKVRIHDYLSLDVYILHMDADYYDPIKCPNISGDIEARKSQLIQLTSYILDRNSVNPIIIMGDTNSTIKYSWDVDNINEYLLKPINNSNYLTINEAVPNDDIDRIFYINNVWSVYELKLIKCYYDKNIHFSDHYPFIAELEINDRK